MNKNEKTQVIVTVVLVAAALILIIYSTFFNKKEVSEKIDTETISIVNDNSKFFTVSSCVSKYLNYLSIRDTDNLLILLSNDYKTKNSVDKSNIYSFVGSVQGNPEFSPRKMFVQRMSKNVYKYYVYGTITQDVINTLGESIDYYLIVILDEENMTFAIEPYNGEMFK